MADQYDLEDSERQAADPYHTDYGAKYGSDNQNHSKKDYGADDLKKREKSGGDEGTLGGGYTPKGSHGPDKLFGKASNVKKAAAFGSVFGFFAILVFGLAIYFLTSSLRLTSLHTHISEYRLVRSVRNYNRHVNAIQLQKIAMDADDPKAHAQYKKTNLWKKFIGTYKPQLAIQQMKAQGYYDIKFSNGRISEVRIGARTIRGPDIQFGKIFSNRSKWKQFYQELYQATDEALLRDGHGYVYRTRVAKQMVRNFGGKLHFWQRKGADFNNKEPPEARQITQTELKNKINPRAGVIGPVKDTGGDSARKQLQKATDDADEAIEDCLKKASCARQIRAGDVDMLKASGADKIIKNFASDFYNAYRRVSWSLFSVAYPICLIYDGAVDTAKAFMLMQNQAALAAFMSLSTAVSQQKNGDVTGEAVGALNELMGNIANSNPELLAEAKKIDTTSEPYAQAARLQNFDIFDDVFGSPALAKAARSVLWLCPYLLHPVFFGSVILLEIIQLLGPGRIKSLADLVASPLQRRAAGIATNALENRIKKRLADRLVSLKDPVNRKLIRNTGLKFAAGAATLSAIEYGALLLLQSKMNSFINGVDVNDGSSKNLEVSEAAANLVNQMDMGGVAYNNDIDRVQNFGRTMTDAETLQTQETDKQFVLDRKNRRSVFERYFALENGDSVLAQSLIAADDAMRQPKRIAASVLSLPKKFANVLGSIFKPNIASAQAKNTVDKTNYNILQWGWTDQEIATIENDETIAWPLVNAKVLEDSGKEKAISDLYLVCFQKDISELQSTKPSGADSKYFYVMRDQDTGQIIPNQGRCSPVNLSANNPRFGLLMLRWRYNQALQKAAIELNDIQNAKTVIGPGGDVGIANGFTFPLRTTQAVIKAGVSGATWCYQSQANCHLYYNAADIHAPPGTPVISPLSCVVTLVKDNSDYPSENGSRVTLRCDDERLYYLTHMGTGSLVVTEGQTLNPGDNIGVVGTSENAAGTAPHLHIDALPYSQYKERPGCASGECAGYPFIDLQPQLVAAFNSLGSSTQPSTQPKTSNTATKKCKYPEVYNTRTGKCVDTKGLPVPVPVLDRS